MAVSKAQFIQVVQRNQGIIQSLCKAYYQEQEDQKDAYQDIVLQLWKSFDSFRGDSAVGTWIYKVALNTILSKVRKEKKKIVTEPLSTSTSHSISPMADDDLELLNLIIHSLKALDKAIVILYLEGYKNKEISEILSLTPTNVSTRFNRVKAELKTKFKSQTHETQ